MAERTLAFDDDDVGVLTLEGVDRSGKTPAEVFEYLLECGLGSTPGTAAEVLAAAKSLI